MLRIGLLVLTLLAIVAFTIANWAAFNASTVLTLGVVSFTAPLGLLLLFALVIVTLVFLIGMALWQGRILADSRRHTRELAAQRALADEAEASRFTALRAALAEDGNRLELRIEALETTVRAEIRDGVNSLAAMVGEMDDRLASADGSTAILESYEPPRS